MVSILGFLVILFRVCICVCNVSSVTKKIYYYYYYAATSKRILSKCDEQKVDFMGKNTNWSFSVAEWDIEGM